MSATAKPARYLLDGTVDRAVQAMRSVDTRGMHPDDVDCIEREMAEAVCVALLSPEVYDRLVDLLDTTRNIQSIPESHNLGFIARDQVTRLKEALGVEV